MNLEEIMNRTDEHLKIAKSTNLLWYKDTVIEMSNYILALVAEIERLNTPPDLRPLDPYWVNKIQSLEKENTHLKCKLVEFEGKTFSDNNADKLAKQLEIAKSALEYVLVSYLDIPKEKDGTSLLTTGRIEIRKALKSISEVES